MGLEGTLRAFSVTEVLQVLGLQRKTGILTVEGKEDTISAGFLNGQIVTADSTASSLEERIGNLLVKTGKLPREQLVRALEDQKQNPRRLASLLLRDRLVSPEDLREAVRLQVFRILLGSFRWAEGKFSFRPETVAAYDSDLFLPIPPETVLDEGVQILEDWPKLERKVTSSDVVFRRAAGVENLRLAPAAEERGDKALVVSACEAETWRWVDGKRRVAEILERAFLSDLDVYRGLANLLDRSLVVAERLQPPAERLPPPRPSWVSIRAIGLWVIFLLLAASAAREVPRGPWNVALRPPGETPQVANLFESSSLARLASIERAVRVYYDASGKYPRSLNDLFAAGVLDPEAAIDPYGRPYRYILRSEAGKFSLYGRNSKGDIDLNLSLERSLAPVSEPASSHRKKPADAKPGVQVVQ